MTKLTNEEKKEVSNGISKNPQKNIKQNNQVSNTSQSERKSGNKILFWILFTIGVIFSLIILISGFSIWFVISLILWGWFLHRVWLRSIAGAVSIGETISISIVLIILSLLFINMASTSKKADKENNQTISQLEDNANEIDQENNDDESTKTAIDNSIIGIGTKEKCDNTASYENTIQKELTKTVVSKNPCKVVWLLADEKERYELKTKKGTVLKVIVWNNYINNLQAGEDFTIRALDVEDTNDDRNNATIKVVRWVPNASELSKAKAEFKEVVENLNF